MTDSFENTRREARRVGLPPRPFLYTMDQIAGLLGMTEATLQTKYIYYQGRTQGIKPLGLMKAIDISEPNNRPDWRVLEQEFVRWLKYKKIRVYERHSLDGK